MTDKEIQEWEKEAKEADETIKNFLFYGGIFPLIPDTILSSGVY